MKKKWTRALALLCTLALALTLAAPVFAAEEPEVDDDGFTRGTEEDSDYWWKLEGGVLTIKGTTMMGDSGNAPWDANRELIRKAVVQEGITNISNQAFSDCSGLTEITIPESVTSIGDYAFSGCSSLTEITFPSSLTSIGSAAFSGCSGLTGSLTIPESLTSIGSAAFSGCSGLTGSLTIPESVTSIGNRAFSGCSGLTGSLAIPNSVTSIGNAAFDGCSGLTGSLTIPESVTSIGDRAFSECSGLTGNLAIPNGVTSIGDEAFYQCSGLTEITLPSSLTSIGNLAFYGCSGLEWVFFAGGAPESDISAFEGCVTTVYYPQDDPTWTEDVRQEYNGTLTWVPYDPANPPDLTPEEPEQPTQPETPEEPEQPTQPETPETPEEPEQPTQPETPSEPEQPTQPETPEEPTQPETPETPEDPGQPTQPETPEEPTQPETPETPEEPEQPTQPETPEEPSCGHATPDQIVEDLAQQVIDGSGNYDLARQLLERLLGNRGISVSARVTEAMRLAIEAAGGITRGHQATENAYIFATYPQSFTEALQLARAEVNAAANSFTLDMNFLEGKQSPLGVYVTVYLKEAFDPTLEYRWYCDDGSVGAAIVELCDNNGYKGCARFYAPHFSTYTVRPVGSEIPSEPVDPDTITTPFAPADAAEAPILKRTGGDVSPAPGIALAFIAAAVRGCALARKRKRKTL